MPASYVDAVRLAGGTAVVLPPGESEPERLLDSVDGLVLSGGGDVGPVCYGGAAHESIYGVSEERDVFEIALARAALARDDRPFLCICRGLQVLNVRSAAISIRIFPISRPARSCTVCRAAAYASRRVGRARQSARRVTRLDRRQGLLVASPSDPHARSRPSRRRVGGGRHHRSGRARAQRARDRDPVASRDQTDDPAQRRLFERFVDLCR